MLINFIKDHWLCFLVGGAVGYAAHWCPMLGHSHGVCPRHTACSCVDCACEVDCNCLKGGNCGCEGCHPSK